MTPQESINKLEAIRKIIMANPRADRKTKMQVLSLFANVESFIEYRIPKPPIDVSEDYHKFTCSKCKTKFDSEDNYFDFNVCPICGQVWKEIK